MEKIVNKEATYHNKLFMKEINKTLWKLHIFLMKAIPRSFVSCYLSITNSWYYSLAWKFTPKRLKKDQVFCLFTDGTLKMALWNILKISKLDHFKFLNTFDNESNVLTLYQAWAIFVLRYLQLCTTFFD